MDIAYLHIVTNHIPIIGVPLALFLLVLGIWRKSAELKAAAFLLFAFLGVATVGVYFLGQGGEDFVEELAGVSHDAIEDHEDFAKYALASVLLLAALSAFALIRYKGFSLIFSRNKTEKEGEASGSFFPNPLVYAVLVLALICGGLLGYTGKLGGKIRHTEFYGGAVGAEEAEEKNEASEEAQEEAGEENDESGRGRGRNRGGRR